MLKQFRRGVSIFMSCRFTYIVYQNCLKRLIFSLISSQKIDAFRTHCRLCSSSYIEVLLGLCQDYYYYYYYVYVYHCASGCFIAVTFYAKIFFFANLARVIYTNYYCETVYYRIITYFYATLSAENVLSNLNTKQTMLPTLMFFFLFNYKIFKQLNS